VSGPGSLELALIMKKKELQNAIFLPSWFRHTCLFPWMFRGLIERYSGVRRSRILELKILVVYLLWVINVFVINVLRILWHIRAIPSYL
jgi:hypothetical protein